MGIRVAPDQVGFLVAADPARRPSQARGALLPLPARPGGPVLLIGGAAEWA